MRAITSKTTLNKIPSTAGGRMTHAPFALTPQRLTQPAPKLTPNTRASPTQSDLVRCGFGRQVPEEVASARR
jgi:hypothetical protein